MSPLPTNVVRLPTAAPRKVRQPTTKAARDARAALHAAAPWPGEYIFPSLREAYSRIEALRALPPSVAANLVRNIVDAPTSEECKSVLRIIKVGAACGDPLALEAKELLERVTGSTIGEQNDFLWAMARHAEQSLG
jgi:hypothetical protein